MMRFADTLRRNERGAAVIELAIAAPILATMLIGVVQLANGYAAKLQLEQVAQREVELWQNSSAGFDSSSTSITAYKTEAATAAGVATSAVTIKYWLECDGTSQNTSTSTMAADFAKVCLSTQTSARYASIELTKAYSPMFATKWSGANSDGSYTLGAKAILRFR
jgi:Flp pilus assembly protein TadG